MKKLLELKDGYIYDIEDEFARYVTDEAEVRKIRSALTALA